MSDHEGRPAGFTVIVTGIITASFKSPLQTIYPKKNLARTQFQTGVLVTAANLAKLSSSKASSEMSLFLACGSAFAKAYATLSWKINTSL